MQRNLLAGITRIELVIVSAIIAGLVAVIYPVVQATRNPRGPHGETYPSEPPNEANRITHPTGLSIILPANWDDLSDTSRFLRIAARGTPGRRLKSDIVIGQCEPGPDESTISQCKTIQFQGSLAYEVCRVERKDSFDDPASSSYSLYVQRRGVWWHVNYLVSDEMNVLPDSVRQYIETISFPDPNAKAANSDRTVGQPSR